MATFSGAKRFFDGLATEADVLAALAGAQHEFHETHHVDLKALPPEPKKADELEKDLAAMTFDGGFLIYGVDEGPPITATPFTVAGVVERIDQAAARLAPPLRIRSRVIESSVVGDGYIVVEVPPSAARVHLTSRGTVPWRDNTTTRLLTASERIAINEDYRSIEREFHDVVLRDYFGSNAKTHADVYYRATVGARPLFPVPDLLLSALQDDPRNMRVEGLAWQMAVSADRATARLAEAIASSEVGIGAVFLNNGSAGPCAVGTTETGILIEGRNPYSGADRFEVEADGAFMIRTANVGDALQYGDERRLVINDAVLILMAYQAAHIAREIADREPGYTGPWLFGTYVRTGDALPRSLQPPENDPLGRTTKGGRPSYSQDSYTRTLAVSRDRLDSPKSVARDIFGTLLHQFGSRPKWVADDCI